VDIEITPLLPELVVPDKNVTGPLTPLVPAFTEPRVNPPLELLDPAPDDKVTDPPVAATESPVATEAAPPTLPVELKLLPPFNNTEPPATESAIESPDRTANSPPTPAWPEPTCISIPPALPPTAAPVAMEINPVLPKLLVPVTKLRAPLTPDTPALTDPVTMAPDEVALPEPAFKDIIPPVAAVVIPLVTIA
jgi:hypothetical protein